MGEYIDVFLETSDLYTDSGKYQRVNIAVTGRRLVAFDGHTQNVSIIANFFRKEFVRKQLYLHDNLGIDFHVSLKDGTFQSNSADLIVGVNVPADCTDLENYVLSTYQSSINEVFGVLLSLEQVTGEKIRPVNSPPNVVRLNNDYFSRYPLQIQSEHYNSKFPDLPVCVSNDIKDFEPDLSEQVNNTTHVSKNWYNSGFSHNVLTLTTDNRCVGYRIQFFVNSKYICSVDTVLYNSILEYIRLDFYYKRWRFRGGAVESSPIDGELKGGLFETFDSSIPEANLSVLTLENTRALAKIQGFLRSNLYPVIEKKISDYENARIDIDGIKRLFEQSGEGIFKYADKFGEPYTVYREAQRGIDCFIRAYAKTGRKDKGRVYVESYFITLGDYITFIYNCLKLLKRGFLVDQTYFASVGSRNAKRIKVSCNCSKEAFLSLMCKVWGVPTSYLSTRAGLVKILGENEFGVLSVVEMKGVSCECFCLKSSFDVKNIHEFEE